MFIEELNSLVGLSLEEAEKKVVESGMKARSFTEDEITTQAGLPANVVMIRYNEDTKVVISAVTQATIDASWK